MEEIKEAILGLLTRNDLGMGKEQLIAFLPQFEEAQVIRCFRHRHMAV